jgi:CheY-like chemotaxis protein
VVDDSIPNRKILCRLLVNGGFICTQAENGKIGLDLTTENLDNFDIILMDFEMPVMDGPSATKAIRAAGYKRPIVGITGNVLESDKRIFLDAGASEVLYKPLTLKSFNDCLERLSK